MSESAPMWADPRLVYPVAAAAVGLLVATVWLFRRKKPAGRPAAAICLALSAALHVALIALVPFVVSGGGSTTTSETAADHESGDQEVSLSTFDPEHVTAEVSGETPQPQLGPLPLAGVSDLLEASPEPVEKSVEAVERPAEPAEPSAVKSKDPDAADDANTDPPADPMETANDAVPGIVTDTSSATLENASDTRTEMSPATARTAAPASLAEAAPDVPTPDANELDEALGEILGQAFAGDDRERTGSQSSTTETVAATDRTEREATAEGNDGNTGPTDASSPPPVSPPPAKPGSRRAGVGDSQARSGAPAANVAGEREADFANRVGEAKERALAETGGDAGTESAVADALAFLAESQESDGSWDASASGAGRERAPLGETRGGAGLRADNAITGLALLAFTGAGNTHREGPYAETVYRGLAYLIGDQKPDGSLAGDASVYAANYSHGMAALAMAEAAALTGDPSASESTRRAIGYTQRMQHPVTGGFRYRQGDRGDLSQLGWQAMVLDAAARAGAPVDPGAIRGVHRFLRSVRAGSDGGLACYRPGEAATRTMTAEALATRLLLGERVPSEEIAEAERFLLEQPPGVGQDNYYYWYYGTVALHQLQDDAWRRWNAALKRRLVATQRPDGSWSSKTVWGGYGGMIYSTSMATLCLEAYYRHAVRRDAERVANLPGDTPQPRSAGSQ